MSEPETSDKRSQEFAGKRPMLVLGVLGVAALVGMVTDDQSSEQSTATFSTDEVLRLPSDSLPEEIRLTMTDYEIELYNKDPSSMGFPPEDLMFLRELGVTPEEARATETIMRKENILRR